MAKVTEPCQCSLELSRWPFHTDRLCWLEHRISVLVVRVRLDQEYAARCYREARNMRELNEPYSRTVQAQSFGMFAFMCVQDRMEELGKLKSELHKLKG